MISWLSTLIPTLFSDAWNVLRQRPSGQIHELDGLRAFAVLLVIATHCGQVWFSAGGESTRILSFPLVQGGWIGVDLFFCLSGFFIGRQLWKEFSESSTVQVRRFILRRGFRIWPLYFVFLFLSFCFNLPGLQGVPGTFALWPELLFLSNYIRGHWVPGSWSLATEEQFYLVIPFLILGLTAISKSLKHGRILFGVLFLCAPVIRLLVWRNAYHPGDSENEVILNSLYFPFHTHLDGLIAGMFLSNLSVSGRFRRMTPDRKAWGILVGLSALAVALKKIDHVLFEYTSLCLVFGGVIWFCLNSGPNWLSRFLGWRGFYVVSRLSYGMYLMHQVPLHSIARGVVLNLSGFVPSCQFVALFLLNVGVTMGLAFFGFALVEQPFLNLRHKLGIEDGVKRALTKKSVEPATA